ncbi:unnamed protein product, partial [Brassica rapa]
HLILSSLLISGMAWREDTSTSDIQIWSFLARNHSFGFRRVRRHPNQLAGGYRRRLTAEESKEG